MISAAGTLRGHPCRSGFIFFLPQGGGPGDIRRLSGVFLKIFLEISCARVYFYPKEY